MNEGAKTGIYWATAMVLVAIAIFVSLPPQTDSDTQALIGQPLFPAFADPLAASSLRIVTFDETQGELRRFEVAKDESSGVWSLPSRNNYPADATEQMQRAANALVGVKILDIQSENAEDHASFGVVEPKPEALEVGDEGVGRLVSIRGDKNAALANVIIGNRVGDSGDRRYVRIPQQDPVYVVNLDDSVFSTKLEDWIEKDLLQLSSIDVSNVDLENYDAALQPDGRLSLERSYDAKLAVDGSNNWELLSLTRYDDQQEPQSVTLGEGEKLATAKLNDLKNALDDLKIVDVAAKPKGMSENLKADKDLVSDNEAIRSLAVRGFFPVSSGEILSANGEMNVTLKDGVKYILRFGNVQGLSAEGEGDDEVGGANRYLLVTAQVDESKFPPPQLRAIPQTIEELEALSRADEQDDAAPADADPAEAAPAGAAPADTPAVREVPADTDPAPADSDATEQDAGPAAPTEPTDSPAPAEPVEPADAPAPAEPELSGEGITTGQGTAGGAGQGQDSEAPQDPQLDGPEPVAEVQEAEVSEVPAAEDAPTPLPAAAAPAAAEPAAAEPAATEPTSTQAPAATEPAAAADETDEEKQERLEAEQEKITKENQRKLDERKDRVDAARRRVRELNSRFAEWYYVIPESTYRKLRISYEDLIEQPAPAENADAPAESLDDEAAEAPSFGFPPGAN